MVPSFLRRLLLLSCLPVCLLAQEPPSGATVLDERSGQQIANGQLVVTLHPSTKVADLKPLMEHFNAKYDIVRSSATLNQHVLAVAPERLHELRERLGNHPYVLSCGLNTFTKSAQMPVRKPNFNDPVFNKPADQPEDDTNWNLYRIKAPEAWPQTTGGALIAVLDTGAKLDHEELLERTVAPFSFAVDPQAREGIKRIRRGADVRDGDVRDHGTHVAITAGGRANNNVGTVGIAPNSPVMPIQVLYASPARQNDGTFEIGGRTDEIIAGIERAINAGASVINMSLGGEISEEHQRRVQQATTPEALAAVENEVMPAIRRQAEQYARVLELANRRGVIVVVSAGNQGIPAHFTALPLTRLVIAVAATDRNDARAGFSNYGELTTVSAPGSQIYSGLARNTDIGFYGKLDGTSMAAPHVTGLVALMKTIDPELRLADVADILITTGRRLVTDKPIGPLVDAKAALDETRRRRDQRVPRQPDPQPITPVEPPPVFVEQPLPPLPPNPIEIIQQPDPWNNFYFQQIVRLWLSIAIVAPPEGGDPRGVWVYNRFGQVVNLRVTFGLPQPVWFSFSYRWFWENAMVLSSTNMGSLYEFVVGTLRQGRWQPVPVRIPVEFRPRPEDPRPRTPTGIAFDPSFHNTRWVGQNPRRETIEFTFTDGTVTIKRGTTTTRYRVFINTMVNPMTIDLVPTEGTPIRGLLMVTGFGEIVFRTDFTATRPTNTYRTDPLAFTLKRADIEIVDPGTTTDGQEMPVLRRGYEARLLTYKVNPKDAKDAKAPLVTLPEGFSVQSFALSRDGRKVWAALVAPALGGNPIRRQLWVMDTDGTNAKEIPFTHDPKELNAPTVLTNADGSIAWLCSARPVPFQNHFHVQLQRVTRDGAKVVLETKSLKDITGGWHYNVTADGETVYFLSYEGVVRVNAGHATVIAKTKEVKYAEFSLLGGTERLDNLSISGDGQTWAATASYWHRDGKYQSAVNPKCVIVGRASHTTAYRIEKGYVINNISLSADGQTVFFDIDGEVHTLRNGKIERFAPYLFNALAGTVAGNGRSLVALGGIRGTSNIFAGFRHDLTTGQRQAVFTRYPRPAQASDDGRVFVAHINGFYNEVINNSLWVSHPDKATPADFPQLKSVRQKYENGKFVLTVQLTTDEPLWASCYPLYDGWINPGHVLERTKNPTFALQGLPDGHRLVPVKDKPGVFQTTVDLGPAQANLSDRYTLRVYLENGARNRLTYVDVPILK